MKVFILLLLLIGSAQAESGMASWYGPGFYGHRTACGQRLSKGSFWVAHKRLPCGATVRVTAGKRSIVAKVLDRGPYVRGRIIDLAPGAARALGVKGTIHVIVERIK